MMAQIEIFTASNFVDKEMGLEFRKYFERAGFFFGISEL